MMIFFGAGLTLMCGRRASETAAIASALCVTKVRRLMDMKQMD
jgi:hypothetical protein